MKLQVILDPFDLDLPFCVQKEVKEADAKGIKYEWVKVQNFKTEADGLAFITLLLDAYVKAKVYKPKVFDPDKEPEEVPT